MSDSSTSNSSSSVNGTTSLPPSSSSDATTPPPPLPSPSPPQSQSQSQASPPAAADYDDPSISTPASYVFPHSQLKRRLSHPDKTPLVLVACGSFSPITVLHLQMFEMAERYVHGATDFEVVGSYLSPVSDAYQKPSLVPAHHRMTMATLAVRNGTHTNIMVDQWETLRCNPAGEPVYTRTVDVLHHINRQVNDVIGGIQSPDGSYKRANVVLLIGADVAMTMSDPKSWAPADLDVILGTYGAFIVERPTQTDIQEALKPLRKYEDKIWVVNSFYNDVSSTKIRAQLQNGESVLDLPKSVFEYIKQHGLYQQASDKKEAKTNGSKDSAPANSPAVSNS